MIQAKNLYKSFGRKNSTIAVNDLSFNVESGKVTGFVGPNGAGKSTTMRLMLGLDKGRGKTLFDGKELYKHSNPARTVGVLLEAKAFHPTRSAKNHLTAIAYESKVDKRRVSEVLELVGLSSVAKKSPGKFSLGMSQRLSLAAALLSKPKYLLLDEPANGLDPEGILWLRNFIKDYANAGNGVLISSHLLSELSQVADNMVVIGKGKLITSSTVSELLQKGPSTVFVRVDKLSELENKLSKANVVFKKRGQGLEITGSSTDDIGKIAHSSRLTVLELAKSSVSLEDAFLEITDETQEYKGK